MTTSSRLAAHRATVTAAQAQEDEEMPNPPIPGEEDDEDCEAGASKKKEPKPMPEDNDNDAAIAAARKEATAAANARFTAVLASEHYAGRETLAHTLLGNEALSAEDIVSALAAAPAPAPAATAPDGEKDDSAARAEMKAAIEETGNSDLVTGADKTTDKKASIDASWDRARAAANPHLKIKE